MRDLIWTPTSERLAVFDWWTLNEEAAAAGVARTLNALITNVWPGVLQLRGGPTLHVVSLLSETQVHSKFKQAFGERWLRGTPAEHLEGEVYYYPVYAHVMRQIVKEGEFIA